MRSLLSLIVVLALVSLARCGPGSTPVRAGGDSTAGPFVSIPTSAAAWRLLPAAEKGAGAPLPPWARALATTLPWTTAALLELDYLHRVQSPLDALLRAKVRLTVARANACAATEAEATADLRRAGLDDAALEALAAEFDVPAADKRAAQPPADERAVLAFARKLTLQSYAVTDDEVAALRQRHGDRHLVALVQHIAYANFQDRLLLALGLDRATQPPLPALKVRFVRPELGARLAQPRSKPGRVGLSPPASAQPDPQWAAADLEALRLEVERQKTRRPRIGLVADHDAAVHWGAVCRAHQPELARAWSYCMWTFGAEAFQHPVLEASVLWVVTRTQQSFY